MNKDIQELKNLAKGTSYDTELLDRVYKEALFPLLKSKVKHSRSNRITISGNGYKPNIKQLMKEVSKGRHTLQTFIETEMKQYLIDKGYRVITKRPSYSVDITF